jgi:hypothetical protein
MPKATINWGFKDKTFWNWMELLIVPVILATGAWYIDMSQSAKQEALEKDRMEEARRLEDVRYKTGILNDYRRSITELVKDGGLLSSPPTCGVIEAAKTLTKGTLPQLGAAQKGALLSFLFDFELIGHPSRDNAVISVLNADFSDARLIDTNLSAANLNDANLVRADLTEATLIGTYLDDAILTNAKLGGATLMGAQLVGADLSGTDLKNTVLIEADLENVDLRRAVDLTCEQLQEATNWESTYRDESLACGGSIPEKPNETGYIIIVEEVIEEIAAPVDCVT